jgi:hypothetical protein
MSDAIAWAFALGIPSRQAAEFDRLAASVEPNSPEILRLMVDHAIQLDRQLGDRGPCGIAERITARDAVEVTATHAVNAFLL